MYINGQVFTIETLITLYIYISQRTFATQTS